MRGLRKYTQEKPHCYEAQILVVKDKIPQVLQTIYDVAITEGIPLNAIIVNPVTSQKDMFIVTVCMEKYVTSNYLEHRLTKIAAQFHVLVPHKHKFFTHEGDIYPPINSLLVEHVKYIPKSESVGEQFNTIPKTFSKIIDISSEDE